MNQIMTHRFLLQISPDIISSVDGYAVTTISLFSSFLFVIGFGWFYGFHGLIKDFIFWYDPTYPKIVKSIVIYVSVVVPFLLLVSLQW